MFVILYTTCNHYDPELALNDFLCSGPSVLCLTNQKSGERQLTSTKFKFAVFSLVLKKSLANGIKRNKFGSFDFRHVICPVCRNWNGSGLIRNRFKTFHELAWARFFI